MAVTDLPNYDIGGIVTPEDGLEMINRNLSLLKASACGADMESPEDRKALCHNIGFIKQYYERVDMLLTKRGL